MCITRLLVVGGIEISVVRVHLTEFTSYGPLLSYMYSRVYIYVDT